MTDAYTVFDVRGQSSPALEPPPVGSGLVWVRGTYADKIRPSPFEVRVGAGMHAWFIIMELEEARGDFETLIARREGQLTEEDIDAAIHHYFRHKEEIDAKIQAHYAPAI